MFKKSFHILLSLLLLFSVNCCWKWEDLDSGLTLIDSKGNIINNQVSIPEAVSYFDLTIKYSGHEDVEYMLKSDCSWVSFGESSGRLNQSKTIRISFNRGALQEGNNNAKVTVSVDSETRVVNFLVLNYASLYTDVEEVSFGYKSDKQYLHVRSIGSKAHVILTYDSPWLLIPPQDREFDILSYDESKPETEHTVTLNIDREKLIEPYETTLHISTSQNNKIDKVITVKASPTPIYSDYYQSIDDVLFCIDDVTLNADKKGLEVSYFIEYNSSGNKSSKTISLEPAFVVDNLGHIGDVPYMTIKKGNSSAVMGWAGHPCSIDLSRGEKATGTIHVAFPEEGIGGLQYIDILYNSSSSFVFKDVKISGIEYKPLSTPETSIWGDDSYLYIVDDVVDGGNETSISFLYKTGSKAKTIGINHKEIVCIDNNNIHYKCKELSLAGVTSSPAITMDVPANVILSGRIVFPVIDSISYFISSIVIPISVDSARQQCETSSVSIKGRVDPHLSYDTKQTVAGLSFISLGAKEIDGQIVLSYLIKNTNNLPIYVTESYDDSYQYAFDDRGGEYSYTSSLMEYLYWIDGNVAMEPNESIHGEYWLNNVSKEASKITYLHNLFERIGSTQNTHFQIRDIPIEGRTETPLPEPYKYGTVSSCPSGLSVDIMDCEPFGANSVHVSFRITNTSDVEKSISIRAGSSFSYAFDDTDDVNKRAVSQISVGLSTTTSKTAELIVPTGITCNGSIIIEGVSVDAYEISKVLLSVVDSDPIVMENVRIQGRSPVEEQSPCWEKNGVLLYLRDCRMEDNHANLVFRLVNSSEESVELSFSSDGVAIDSFGDHHRIVNKVRSDGETMVLKQGESSLISMTVEPEFDHFAYGFDYLTLPLKVQGTRVNGIRDILIEGTNGQDWYGTICGYYGKYPVYCRGVSCKDNFVLNAYIENTDESGYFSIKAEEGVLFDNAGMQFKRNSFQINNASIYPNKTVAVPAKTRLRFRLVESPISEDASGVQYIDIPNSNSSIIMKDLKIVTRTSDPDFTPSTTGEIETMPSRTSISLLHCVRNYDGDVVLSFIIQNTATFDYANPGNSSKRITFVKSSSYSYAYDNINYSTKREVYYLKTGMNDTAGSSTTTLSLPGGVFCKCEIRISGVSTMATMLSSVTLKDMSNDNSSIVFKNVVIE